MIGQSALNTRLESLKFSLLHYRHQYPCLFKGLANEPGLLQLSLNILRAFLTSPAHGREYCLRGADPDTARQSLRTGASPVVPGGACGRGRLSRPGRRLRRLRRPGQTAAAAAGGRWITLPAPTREGLSSGRGGSGRPPCRRRSGRWPSSGKIENKIKRYFRGRDLLGEKITDNLQWI